MPVSIFPPTMTRHSRPRTRASLMPTSPDPPQAAIIPPMPNQTSLFPDDPESNEGRARPQAPGDRPAPDGAAGSPADPALPVEPQAPIDASGGTMQATD